MKSKIQLNKIEVKGISAWDQEVFMVIQGKIHGPLQRRPLHRHNSEQLPSMSHRRASLNLQLPKVGFAYEYESRDNSTNIISHLCNSVKIISLIISKSALFLFLHTNYPISPTPCFIPELIDSKNHKTRVQKDHKGHLLVVQSSIQ